MLNEQQINNQVNQIIKYMKEHRLCFIRNNDRYRKEFELNQRQFSYVLKYLVNTGLLEPRSKKIYQIPKNSNLWIRKFWAMEWKNISLLLYNFLFSLIFFIFCFLLIFSRNILLIIKHYFFIYNVLQLHQ